MQGKIEETSPARPLPTLRGPSGWCKKTKARSQGKIEPLTEAIQDSRTSARPPRRRTRVYDTMQRDPSDTQGPDKEHSDSRDAPRPTGADYKALYDDLMTLRQSWELEDPAQWNSDGAPHTTKDPWP
nr:hypothetical protein [Pandoravirus belohorizontensis]